MSLAVKLGVAIAANPKIRELLTPELRIGAEIVPAASAQLAITHKRLNCLSYSRFELLAGFADPLKHAFPGSPP